MKNLFLKGFVVLILCSCSKEEIATTETEEIKLTQVETRIFSAPGSSRKLKNPIPSDVMEDPCEDGKGNCGPIGDVPDELAQRIEAGITAGTIAELFSNDQEIIEYFGLSPQALSDLQTGITSLLRVNNTYVVVYSNSDDPFNYPPYFND